VVGSPPQLWTIDTIDSLKRLMKHRHPEEKALGSPYRAASAEKAGFIP
jgi:hypothetical protein